MSAKKKEIDSVSCSSEWKKIVFAPYYYNHQGNILDFNFCIIEITQHRRRGLKLWAQSLQSLVCGTWLVARYSPATLSDIHEWEITCSSAQSGGRCFALFPSWNSWLPWGLAYILSSCKLLMLELKVIPFFFKTHVPYLLHFRFSLTGQNIQIWSLSKFKFNSSHNVQQKVIHRCLDKT